MSDPGPLPEPRGRRRWLWITLGILGACLLICCGFGIWVSTAGRDWVCDQATEVARERTPTTDEDDVADTLEEFCREE